MNALAQDPQLSRYLQRWQAISTDNLRLYSDATAIQETRLRLSEYTPAINHNADLNDLIHLIHFTHDIVWALAGLNVPSL